MPGAASGSARRSRPISPDDPGRCGLDSPPENDPLCRNELPTAALLATDGSVERAELRPRQDSNLRPSD